jgi:hypothetical protein
LGVAKWPAPGRVEHQTPSETNRWSNKTSVPYSVIRLPRLFQKALRVLESIPPCVAVLPQVIFPFSGLVLTSPCVTAALRPCLPELPLGRGVDRRQIQSLTGESQMFALLRKIKLRLKLRVAALLWGTQRASQNVTPPGPPSAPPTVID